MGHLHTLYGTEIEFSTSDKFSDLKYNIQNTLCFLGRKDDQMENKKRFLNDNEILYQGAYESIEERLDLINIVKRIQKIESAISAVIKDDDLLIK